MQDNLCEIYVVRHGLTDWNRERKLQGQTDIPLNKEGEEQAEVMRERLSQIKFDKVYSSDLLRAKRTAEIIALEKRLAVETTKLLRERNYGSFEGEKVTGELIDKLYNSNSDEMIQIGMETDESLISRLFTFLREVSISHLGKRVLVVCHGGVMRTLLIHLGEFTKEEKRNVFINNLAFVRLESDGVEFFVKEKEGIELLEKF